MKAIRFHNYGGAEVLKYEEVPVPKPSKGEVLIRIHAAGVNPVDYKIRAGFLKEVRPYDLPMIPGCECAGIIEETGTDVINFKKGDKVFADLGLDKNGAYAEYAVVHETKISLKPETVDYIHAAAIPICALTAWQALFDTAQLSDGQSVLIHAAAGGVGHFAVQLAKWKGTHVTGTASANNQQFLRELGADKTIDYKKVRFEDVVRNVDVVIDAVGGDVPKRSLKVLKKGGIVVSIAGSASPEEVESYGVRFVRILVKPEGAQLAKICELVNSGDLKPVVENILPLQEAAQAHKLSESGHTRGKIVLKIL